MASAIYYLFLSLFTVICFVPFAVLFALTVFFDKERVALHWASRVWSYGIFRLCPLWKLRVEGREKIDRSRPWVIVTNHQSMLDIPLMYVLPLNFKWVSKKEVQKMPIFGWVLWMHGDIPVERGSRRSAKRMMERCVERLSRGTSVIVFPEGTPRLLLPMYVIQLENTGDYTGASAIGEMYGVRWAPDSLAGIESDVDGYILFPDVNRVEWHSFMALGDE